MFATIFLDELRARVSVSTVVARRVKLSRAGREMKGCCPFHDEKSASFFVNDDKGFYHCFGCGAHGDVIRFVVEQEGLGFIDAVKSLAAEAGLALPEETPEARERSQAAEGLHDVTGKAAAWFSSQLRDAGGATARDYLAKRGITDKTAADFSLGYSPDSRTHLRAALASVGDAKLVETGLLIAPDDGGDPYDRFRARLMFPIRDPRGRVVGFGGRILGDGQPKYLNSPDTPLFDKGRILFNLDRARPVSRKSMRLIIVEGYMDVIALAQAGFEDVVAPLGTALTEAQLGLAWRIAPEPILCFDGDLAGQSASLRAALLALPFVEPGQSLRFATLPAGLDPDDLIRESGALVFEQILATAEPLIDRLWRSESEGVDTSTPERRAAVLAKVEALADRIAHPGLKKFYRTELRDRFFALRPRREWPPRHRAASPGLIAASLPNVGQAVIRPVLTALLLRPALADAAFEGLASLSIPDIAQAELMGAILSATCAHEALDAVGLRRCLGSSLPIADLILARHRPGIEAHGFLDPAMPLAAARNEFANMIGAMSCS
ncbi:MAG: DNA primase [Janthinobacterium lividum]